MMTSEAENWVLDVRVMATLCKSVTVNSSVRLHGLATSGHWYNSSYHHPRTVFHHLCFYIANSCDSKSHILALYRNATSWLMFVVKLINQSKLMTRQSETHTCITLAAVTLVAYKCRVFDTCGIGLSMNSWTPCWLSHSVDHAIVCLTDTVFTITDNPTQPSLHSADSTLYRLPRCRTSMGECVFSFSGPLAWSALPSSLRYIADCTRFTKLLQTHFCNSLA